MFVIQVDPKALAPDFPILVFGDQPTELTPPNQRKLGDHRYFFQQPLLR